jgi:hypothetical protein
MCIEKFINHPLEGDFMSPNILINEDMTLECNVKVIKCNVLTSIAIKLGSNIVYGIR